MNSKIKQHVNNYYQQLFTHKPVQLATLMPTFLAMESLLANNSADYVLSRVPSQVVFAEKIILAHDISDLEKLGYKMQYWEKCSAPDRRRRNFYQENIKTLACLITSLSDVDDLVNSLLAYPTPLKCTIELLDGNEENFREISHNWWHEVNTRSLIFGLSDAPIYFVFSNLHAISNIVGGYVREEQNQIFQHAQDTYPDLMKKWQEIKDKNVLRVNDFLYYISSLFLKDKPDYLAKKNSFEVDLGFRKVSVESELFCDASIIPVSALAGSNLVDPYLNIKNKEKISQSKAFIINIDYPLGLSAYYLLSEILKTKLDIKGIYIQGKAAILSGQIGDLQIPMTVFDERDEKEYQVKNVFNENFPAIAFQANVHKNQKSVSVYGTFLENREQLETYLNQGVNVVEMEAGPYLKAVEENKYSGELGIINYASDNPLSKTLAEGPLGIKGVEPTYLGSLSIVQRIIDLES